MLESKFTELGYVAFSAVPVKSECQGGNAFLESGGPILQARGPFWASAASQRGN